MGVDSFDGLEYDSSEYEDEFPKEEHEQKWRRFKLIENKGFYVEPELCPSFNWSRKVGRWVIGESTSHIRINRLTGIWSLGPLKT
ncbi:unnamed protein product [Arabidopsis halleri]